MFEIVFKIAPVSLTIFITYKAYGTSKRFVVFCFFFLMRLCRFCVIVSAFLVE